MPHPEKARGPWTDTFIRVFIGWLTLMLGSVVGVTGTANPFQAKTAALNEVRIGNHDDYIRIVFELSQQVQYQIDDTILAGSISVQLSDTIDAVSGKQAPVTSGCLDKVIILQQGNHVIATLRFDPVWRRLNAFTIKEPDRIVLDVFCGEAVGPEASPTDPRNDRAEQPAESAREETPVAAEPGSASPETQAVHAGAPPENAPDSLADQIDPPKPVGAIGPADELEIQPAPTVEPVQEPRVAPDKDDPFQKYLLILLAAITGIIIVLIALIIYQKMSISAGSETAVDPGEAEPDDTMRALDTQIKAKLMKYDD